VHDQRRPRRRTELSAAPGGDAHHCRDGACVGAPPGRELVIVWLVATVMGWREEL